MFPYCRKIVSSVHGALKKIAFNKSRAKSKPEPPTVNNSEYLSDVSDASDIDDYNELELPEGPDKECICASSPIKKVKVILKDSKENNLTDIEKNDEKYKNKEKEFYCCEQCTCGVSSRFLHPGVTDEGNFTMCDMVKPTAYPPDESRPHVEIPSLMRPLSGYSAHVHAPKPEDYSLESAWEQGFLYANQMMQMAREEIYRDAWYYSYDSYYRRVQYEADSQPGSEYRVGYHAVPQVDLHCVSHPTYPRERKRKREHFERYEKNYKSPSRERIPSKTWREEEAPRVKRRRDSKYADPWMEQNSSPSGSSYSSKRPRSPSPSARCSHSISSSQKRQHEVSSPVDNAAAKKLGTRKAVKSRNKYLLEKIRTSQNTIGPNI